MSSLPASVHVQAKSAVIDVLKVENAFSTCEISLWGGHVVSFIPKHDLRERLFVSEAVCFDTSRPIRGGIPICWPWFGAHSVSGFPAHGYVRDQPWRLVKATEGADGTTLVLMPQQANMAGFEGEAYLQLSIHVGKRLTLTLLTQNVGDQDFSYTAALHSYFSVKAVGDTEIMGITGEYLDKLDKNAQCRTPVPYTIFAETDRVHLQAASSVEICQQGVITSIESTGHDSLVVWNPWIDKSAKMVDMNADSYQKMLCIETAVTQDQVVKAGASHALVQSIG